MFIVVCFCWLKLWILMKMLLNLHESCTWAMQKWLQAKYKIFFVVELGNWWMIWPNSLKNQRSSTNKIILCIVCYVNIYNNIVRPVLNGIWAQRKSVFSGKLLQSRRPGFPRIQILVALWNGTWLLRKIPVSCGSVTGRFQSTSFYLAIYWNFSLSASHPPLGLLSVFPAIFSFYIYSMRAKLSVFFH